MEYSRKFRRSPRNRGIWPRLNWDPAEADENPDSSQHSEIDWGSSWYQPRNGQGEGQLKMRFAIKAPISLGWAHQWDSVNRHGGSAGKDHATTQAVLVRQLLHPDEGAHRDDYERLVAGGVNGYKHVICKNG